MNENLFTYFKYVHNIINFIRASVVNSRIFKVMCEEIG